MTLQKRHMAVANREFGSFSILVALISSLQFFLLFVESRSYNRDGERVSYFTTVLCYNTSRGFMTLVMILFTYKVVS